MQIDSTFKAIELKKVLCVRLDYLGDVLMCTPAIRAIKEAQPWAKITLLTSSGGAAVAPFVPEIDDVIIYAAPWMKSSAPQARQTDLAMVERLREERFDAAVIFTTYSQSALPSAMLCYLAGIPVRIAHCRENPYQMLSHWVPEIEPQKTVRHEVQRQLDLVANLGCHTENTQLSFRLRDHDIDWVRAYLFHLGVEEGHWVLMHPGATAPSRRYPVHHWAEVAKTLFGKGFSIVFTGGRDELGMINEIIEMAGVPAFSLAGALDLGKLGAAISLAPVMVVNNTGPAHMAAAIGTPLVVPYALTNPQHTPWQANSRVLYHDVPCRICYKSACPQGHHDCLEKVAPEDVVDAVLELLGFTEAYHTPAHVVPISAAI